ncbi:MAG: DUF3667 domain-containing protein [Phycisphaerales bacterium]|nr:DUF3667 domain-containing protein [Phycisphaerales bacterium]
MTDPTPADLPVCRSCGQSLGGRYCAHCGQASSTARLSFRAILGQVVESVFELDSPFLRTVVDLTRRPGTVCREYVAGRRRQYASPFKYCLIMAALYVVALNWFDVDLSKRINTQVGGETEVQAAAVQALVQEITVFVRSHLNSFIFFALPVLALLLRGLFRRAGLNVAEHYAFALFVFGQRTLFLTLLVPFGIMEWPQAVVPIATIEIIYTTWAALRFYGVGWFAALWRIIVAQLVLVVVMGVLAGATAIVLFGPRMREAMRAGGAPQGASPSAVETADPSDGPPVDPGDIAPDDVSSR